MMNIITVGLFTFVLAGCGASDSVSSNSTIRSTDYALPTAVPSVPDQSGKQ